MGRGELLCNGADEKCSGDGLHNNVHILHMTTHTRKYGYDDTLCVM